MTYINILLQDKELIISLLQNNFGNNMNYRCLELENCLYQPQNTIPIREYWIIPLGLTDPISSTKNFKVVMVQNKPRRKIRDDTYFFVMTYQFLFTNSGIYSFYAPQNYNEFEISGQNISEIELEVKKRYNPFPGHLIKDFKKIDTSSTGLPSKVDFEAINNRIKKNYEKDEKFKDIITLFLHTVSYNDPLYDNLFQKISQFQTIFETILGKPSEKMCPTCKQNRYEEQWSSYIARRLKEKGIIHEKDIEFVIKIKGFLNKYARVKYVHHSSQFDPWQESREAFENLTPIKMRSGTNQSGQSTYTTDVVKCIEKKPEELASIDWMNICTTYQYIVKLLIFLEYMI